MKYNITTPPASTPVTYAQCKTHLRLDTDSEQTYIEDLIAAATSHAENALASSLMTQTITATYYVGEDMHLPRGPVIAITSVTDADGQVIGADDYDLTRIGNSDRILINVSHEHPVTVVYTAGYASASAIPAEIRHAIQAHVATLYGHRESVAEKTITAVPHSLTDFYRLRSRSSGIA